MSDWIITIIEPQRNGVRAWCGQSQGDTAQGALNDWLFAAGRKTSYSYLFVVAPASGVARDRALATRVFQLTPPPDPPKPEIKLVTVEGGELSLTNP